MYIHTPTYISFISIIEKVTVVCNQTSKVLFVQAATLIKEDGHLTAQDLETSGTQFLLNENGKPYPVTLITKTQKQTQRLNRCVLPPPKRKAIMRSEDMIFDEHVELSGDSDDSDDSEVLYTMSNYH